MGSPKTMQIFILDKREKKQIEKRLRRLSKQGYKGKELDYCVRDGMDGRLCDLEDVIEIGKFL